MATWNSAIAADAPQLSDLIWLEHLVSALNQRAAVYNSSPGSGTLIPVQTVVLDQDIQNFGFWRDIQLALSDTISLPHAPGWLDAAAPFNAGQTTIAAAFNSWAETTLRTALGLVNGVQRGGGTPDYYWRRKTPREVLFPTDATDAQANTLANGNLAWLLSSPRATLLATKVAPITDPAAAPTLAALTTGTLPAGTYFVVFSWHNGIGETLASPEASVTLAAPGSIQVTLPAFPSNARVACLYTSDTTGNERLNDTSLTTVYVVNRPEFGAAPPVANQTQWIPAGPTDVPDVIDSDNALATDLHMDPGLSSSGDYLSADMLSELRSVLNALVWMGMYLGSATSGLAIAVGDASTSMLTTTTDIYTQSMPGDPFVFSVTLGPGAGPYNWTPGANFNGAVAVIKYDGAGGFAETLASP